MRLATPLVLSMMLCACAGQEPIPSYGERPTPFPLEELQDLSVGSLKEAIDTSTSEASRLKAVEQVALSTGIRNGRAWRKKEINGWLVEMNRILAITFNFEQLLLDGVYLPPRVDVAKGHVEKLDDGSLRYVRLAFRIVSAPTLVTAPPTYLSYLYQIPDDVTPPNPLGLPVQGSAEERVWKEGVVRGWQLGVKQADIEFQEDLRLLKRDYTGMQRYLDLVAKGLISMPKISSKDFGIVISADGKELNVGDEMMIITRDPSFQSHQKWQVLEEEL